MKLLLVLMLTALPLYCYAGSDCKMYNSVVAKTLDTQVSPDQFVDFLQAFIPDEDTALGLRQFKQCFLNQNAETLNNAKEMEELINNSPLCAGY